MARTGRRPGTTETRAQILDAARSEFAERGYEGATIRAVAKQAEVDPALVLHYFGNKEQLFVAAMDLPLDPTVVIDAVLAEGRRNLGERAVRAMLATWDVEQVRSRLIALLRAGVSNEQAAQMIREFIQREIIGRLVRAIDAPDPELRAALVGSQVLGVLMARYIIGIEPLASADPDTIVMAIGPTVQRYLTGDLGPL